MTYQFINQENNQQIYREWKQLLVAGVVYLIQITVHVHLTIQQRFSNAEKKLHINFLLVWVMMYITFS